MAVTIVSSGTAASSDTVWVTWNSGSITTNTAVTAVNTWVAWNGEVSSGTTTGSIMLRGTWVAWNGSEWVAAGPTAVRETPEQRQQREAREAEHRQRWAEEEAKRVAARKAAEERAEELLHSVLSEEQIQMLTRDGKFLVECKSGRVYEIARGSHQNVYLLDEKRERVQRLCAYATGQLPVADHMVAQSLPAAK